ncbi:hypothetical protein KKF34_13390 [Myxococcota bacterium]|nr:hypothetical protein [Myxococcota bacterium]MBU1383191.1 hypothetical protein [Myxococcota bacterium]MBU1497863.1 hypothetical protein [Myxococcota bacterium]
MGRSNHEDKLHRVLRFLMSFQNSPVAQIMKKRGFDDEELATGWALFDAASGRTLNRSNIEEYEKTINFPAILDAWENTWFDVADAALSRRYPDVHKALFNKVSKQSGLSVIRSVMAFVGHLEDIRSRTDSPWTDAAALLAKRGLDQANIDSINQTMSQMKTYSSTGSEWNVDREEVDKAVEEMWSWYQEWSRIARTVVPNKRMKILMGLSFYTKRKSPEAEPH